MKTRSICLCCLLLSVAANAAVIHIQPNGLGDQPTIQAAINAAAPGDTVMLRDGIFRGNGNRDVNPFGKNVTVMAESPDAYRCILDCYDISGIAHRAFIFESGEDTTFVLSGLTITNGRADYGGAIIARQGSGPMINNCYFENNTADINGGAIAAVGSHSFFILSDSTLRYNTNYAIYVAYGGLGLWRIEQCNIMYNEGGGVMASSGGICGYYDCVASWIIDCDISDNQGSGLVLMGSEWYPHYGVTRSQICRNNGDGISQIGDIDGSIMFVNSSLIHNNTHDGIFTMRSYGCYITSVDIANNGESGIVSVHSYMNISNTNISANQETGITIDSGYPQLNNGVVIANNRSNGLSINSEPDNTSISLNGCQIRGNAGWGILQTGYWRGVINNVIVYRNELGGIQNEHNEHMAISCSDVFMNGNGVDWPGPTNEYLGVDGNISRDPLYCDANEGDYNVMDTSPCLATNNDGCGDIGGVACCCDNILSPISAIKQYSDDTGVPISSYIDQLITIDGVVFVTPETYSSGVYYIQDATGGIKFVDEQPLVEVHEGDRIKITGHLWCDANLELYVGTSGMTILERGAQLEPTLYSIANLKSNYNHVGDYVSVFGRVAAMTPSGFYISQGLQSLEVRIDEDINVDWSWIELGQNVQVTGPCLKELAWFFMSPRSQQDLQLLDGSIPVGVSGIVKMSLNAYPNPLNPSTTINFNLPQDGQVLLSVYDVRGSLVRSLVKADLPRGSHQATWDGRDASGRGMASGSYFARLEAQGKIETVRMSLVR